MNTVEAVANGRNLPIRDIEDIDLLDAGLTKMVQHVANAFGGVKKVDPAILKECVRIARTQFKRLGIPEFTEAYRLWAAKRFPALEMYYGAFNATQFARVMAAYEGYRMEIDRAIAREKNNHAYAEAEAVRVAKNEAAHAARVAAFPKTVRETIANGKYSQPRQILITWYDWAEQHDMIYLAEGEKTKLWNIAHDEIERERAAHLATIKRSDEKRRAVDRFLRAGTGPFIVRTKQYIVWTKVLGRPIPSPVETAPTKMDKRRADHDPNYNILLDPAYFVQQTAPTGDTQH